MINLTEEQKTVVETKERNVLVVAGPGSGKTRCIVERVAWLKEHGESMFDVMAITFTRKAAAELKERIEERIGSDARHITVGTIHSVALDAIRTYSANYHAPTVMDPGEEKRLLEYVAARTGIFNGKRWKIPKKKLDEVFSRYYETGEAPGRHDRAYDLFTAFRAECHRTRSLPYGEILIMFRDMIDMTAKYRRYRHIIVDECQDNDILQWYIIDRLAKTHNADTFCVGDLNQSIYEWRGAVPRHLEAMAENGMMEVMALTRNFRSGPGIVKAANRLIEFNESRLEFKMTANPTNAGSGKVTVFRNMDSHGVAESVIKPLLESMAIHNVAVLGRTHFLLKALANELDEMGIPYHYVNDDPTLANTPESAAFRAYLKLIYNQYDDAAFRFLVDCGVIPVAIDTLYNMEREAIRSDKCLLQVYRERPGKKGEFSISGSFTELLDRAKESLVGTFSPDHEKVFEFYDAALHWYSTVEAGTVKQFLDWLATKNVQDNLKPDMLQLMTIHAAKGLEFQTVVIVGCNEELLPHKNAIKKGDISEERRLMYVAMTRAEDHLVLCVRPESGERFQNPVSRFIWESGVK